MLWRTLFIGATLAMGCRSSGGDTDGSAASASPSASTRAPVPDAALLRLASAEQRRDSAAIESEELTHRDPRVRRLAARALARIADEKALEKLRKLLHDEDAEVMRWAAYGLGYGCKGRAPIVRALTLRAATLLVRDQAGVELMGVFSDALARCGTSDAERTLRSWLDEPVPVADGAARALGNAASTHRRLDDASVVALLDAASRPKPLSYALYAFGRLSPSNPTAQARLLEVATKQVAHEGLVGSFAVRALGGAGDDAASVLREVLSNRKYSPIKRAAAVQALGKLGAAGQAVVAESLQGLVVEPLDSKALLGPAWTPLVAALEALDAPGTAKKPLARLAELGLPKAGTARLRAVALRCRAASLLAGRASLAARLVGCDPDEGGRVGKLAVVRVLDQGGLDGARQRRWLQFVEDEDPVVSQAALRLLASHSEVRSAHDLLAKALGSEHPGTVATAAQVLAAYPARAAAGDVEGSAANPTKPVIEALEGSFDRDVAKKSIETTSALLDAVAALQLLGHKPTLERFCGDDNPTLRDHARRGLALLGDTARECNTFPVSPDTPSGLEQALNQSSPVAIEFESELGKLSIQLEPGLAPMAVARVLELAKAGFFDDMPIHRVVPGFVVQFGDRVGDGYGNGGKAPLRCETSPLPFERFDVGVALAGRDTGASQLFVVLDRFPHLDGNYSLVGHAKGAWDRLAVGDRLRGAKVVQ